MSPPVLALLALVGFGSGFVDAIAGGGSLSGHIFVPAGLALGVGVFSARALVRTPLCEPARGWCGRSSSS
jgi:uncharacterized membrane protein YfcA